MDGSLLEIRSWIECSIVKRLNRFVVEVYVSGGITRAYINNTGRLKEYMARNRRAFCLLKEGGKTSYRLFAVEDQGFAALIDTQLQMRAFEAALSRNMISWFTGCRVIKRNPRLGDSVLDYLVECGGRRVFVEVKSAVLRGDHIYAMYPDCPTLRGRRHIKELINHVIGGGYAAIVFIAALPGVKAFKPYREGDPVIEELLGEAIRRGVIIKALSMYFDPHRSTINLDNPDLPVVCPL